MPPLETQFTEIDMICPRCQARWGAPVARVVNIGTSPDARLGILLKTMHRTHCPACKFEREIDTIFDYYDPDQQLVVQIRPEWEYHAGGGEDWYWERYEDLVEKYAEVEVRVDVVFGFDSMIEKYLGGESAVEAAHKEWDERVAKAKAEREAERAAWEAAEAEAAAAEAAADDEPDATEPEATNPEVVDAAISEVEAGPEGDAEAS